MILQIFKVLFILNIATIGDGASLSNVYVQSEPPVGYFTYGTPYSSIANPRISQVNSQPSVPGYVAPCVSPCVYPQTIATVTAVDPSPNVVAYNANNVPVPVAPTKQEYEYSYIVHDEHTGDHKAQRELSDGSVVQGQYSFLQPDGYIREVQYVADDISGFKAVVKNFLPAAVEGKSNGEEHEKKEPPCHETKNESLKEGSKEDSGQNYLKQLKKIYEILQRKYEESAEKSKETKKIFSEDSSEESEEASEEKTKSKKESSESEDSEKDSDSEEPKKELKVKSHISKKGPKESSDESSEDESEEKVSNGKNKEVHELLKPTETFVPYKDVLRCIEAAIKRNNGVSAGVKQGPSPLTYIVLNKPC